MTLEADNRGKKSQENHAKKRLFLVDARSCSKVFGNGIKTLGC